MKPEELLADLHGVSGEDVLQVWEAFERTPVARHPLMRMEACLITFTLANASELDPVKLSIVLAEETSRGIDLRELANGVDARANNGGPNLHAQLVALAQFHGRPLS